MTPDVYVFIKSLNYHVALCAYTVILAARYLVQSIFKSGAKSEARAMTVRVAEIGRVKKIAKLPWEMVRDWRSDISTIGPRTSARTIGAGG